jgi:Domain of unknown function (DUF4270)
MKFNAFFKASFLIIVMVLIVSCDKDFNEIGANLIDDIHYDFESEYKSVLAYNAPTGVVQTSNLPINSLGFYNNPVFGSTTSSFVTQVELGTVDPKFYGMYNTNGTPNPSFTIDSVYLYVPYFSRVKATDATTGDSTFELDSIYGQNNKLKLEVYRSGYFLRPLDPATGLQEQQRYYNDQINDVNSNALDILNTSANTAQNTEFKFTSNQIKFFKPDGVTVRERLNPGIYMDLNKDSFFASIFNAPAGKLVDNNVFKDYFRGLFFKAEAVNGANAMARLNFAQGRIVIVYKGKDSETATEYKRKTLQLNLVGHTVNYFDNVANPDYANALASANSTVGDEKLYVKGGQGSMAVIKLFSGNEIEEIKQSGWLINEANLVFNIDSNTMNSVYVSDDDDNVEFEPHRIHLFDLNNKRPIIDYSFDISIDLSNQKNNKNIHSGIISKTDGRGTEYKIRLTNHIRNIIKRDSTNVNLGLVITESINNVNNVKLKSSFIAFPSTTHSKEVKFLPAMSVASPLGTVLWGSNIPEGNPNYNKRLRLEIFYTKPD